MNSDQLTHPVVKAAVSTMNAGNREGWLALFAADAVLTDDGSPHDYVDWSNRELFGQSRGYITAIDRVEDSGLTLYAQFHSDRWGDFPTFLKFQVQDGKITRLDVGQTA